MDTIDRSHGMERYRAIVSLRLSDPVVLARQAELLDRLNRLNVAATRARMKCVVLANATLLRCVGPDTVLTGGATTLRRLAAYALLAPSLFTKPRACTWFTDRRADVRSHATQILRSTGQTSMSSSEAIESQIDWSVAIRCTFAHA